MLGRPLRWKFLFRDDTQLTADTILAVAQILKNYELAMTVKRVPELD